MQESGLSRFAGPVESLDDDERGAQGWLILFS
jgi:hypothetical protein